MGVIKSFVISFSMYSRIPMPSFKWEEKDMKYILCFFPWVGIVIGVVMYLWHFLCDSIGIGTLCYTTIGAAIPVIITGGIHVDGFMDTMDAFHSYRPREKKLEILKDSHIGAFSVIMLALYGMVYIGFLSEIDDYIIIKNVCVGFALSRCLSGIGVVTFPAAKKEGLLFLFANNAHRNIVKICLYVQAVLCIGFMMRQSLFSGTIIAVAAIGSFIYYYFRCKKQLGGITGDTAGYFVLLCEECIVMAAAVINIFQV